MDEQVIKAMRRWPDVPDVFGWLRLDRRGRWFLIDRNQPGFDEIKHGAGSLITSPQIIEFIARNYQCDDQQRWYWQNGPQRAYVDLDAAPLIARVMQASDAESGTSALVTHTGEQISRVTQACLGPDDGLYLQTDLGPACVHDLDLASLDTDGTSVRLFGQQFFLTDTPDIAQTLGFTPRPRA